MALLTLDSPATLKFARLGISIQVDHPDSSTISVQVRGSDQLSKSDMKGLLLKSGDNGGETAESKSIRRHAICNQIHIAALSLEMLQLCEPNDSISEVEQTLEIAVESLNKLESLAAA